MTRQEVLNMCDRQKWIEEFEAIENDELVKRGAIGRNALDVALINRIFDEIESRICENCKHFDADERIDPNGLFGWCMQEEYGADAVNEIVVSSFGCVGFEKRVEKGRK